MGRLSTGYAPDFDIDVEFGRQGELLVADVLQQIAKGQACIEVKRSRYHDLRLYVEMAQRPRGHSTYKPSGLQTSKAEYWAFVKPHGVFILVPSLRLLDAAAAHPRPIDAGLNGDNPLRGFFVNAAWLVKE